jgi:hypothetical protein
MAMTRIVKHDWHRVISMCATMISAVIGVHRGVMPRKYSRATILDLIFSKQIEGEFQVGANARLFFHNFRLQRWGVWEMKYRKLGNTGLIVSEVALATWLLSGCVSTVASDDNPTFAPDTRAGLCNDATPAPCDPPRD